tara:strand:+ start:258 stop:449 length:192 start_codon:yes stop_codon:yes gene_type:complete
MKKYIVYCTETIKYEVGVEAESAAHAKEVFYKETNSYVTTDENGMPDSEVQANFTIDTIEEIN